MEITFSGMKKHRQGYTVGKFKDVNFAKANVMYINTTLFSSYHPQIQIPCSVKVFVCCRFRERERNRVFSKSFLHTSLGKRVFSKSFLQTSLAFAVWRRSTSCPIRRFSSSHSVSHFLRRCRQQHRTPVMSFALRVTKRPISPPVLSIQDVYPV